MILVDSNVLIAAFVLEHIHHQPSERFMSTRPVADLAVTAHSLSEVYNHLTRPFPRFNVPPMTALAQVSAVAKQLRLLQLAPAATIEAIRAFAQRGGRGPRLYDYLIGATGEAFGADTIATWNVGHFDRLFPHLRVVTPAELVA